LNAFDENNNVQHLLFLKSHLIYYVLCIIMYLIYKNLYNIEQSQYLIWLKSVHFILQNVRQLKAFVTCTIVTHSIKKKRYSDNLMIWLFLTIDANQGSFLKIMQSTLHCIFFYCNIACQNRQCDKGCGNKLYPRGQFHQHFTRAFFVRKCFVKLFSSYVLALTKGFWQKSTFVWKTRTKNIDEIDHSYQFHQCFMSILFEQRVFAQFAV